MNGLEKYFYDTLEVDINLRRFPKRDILFLQQRENEPPDFRAIAKTMGLPALDRESIINQINKTFLL